MRRLFAIIAASAALAGIASAEWLTKTVSVGYNPIALTVNPYTNRVYIANQSGARVTWLDGSTNATGTITVGSLPMAVAANPVTNRIYVANRLSASVSAIDGATHATTSITVGTEPLALAVNAVTNRIYVANYGSGTVTVINGTTNSTQSVTVGTNPSAVAVNPVTNRIYVANRSSGTVSVIDGISNGVTSVSVGSQPVAVAVNPVTNKVYVVNNGSNSVTVIDGATNGTTPVTVGISPTAVAVNPVTNRIYVANNLNDNVTAINGTTNGTTAIPCGTGPTAIAVNAVTNRVYVAGSGTSLTAIDGATDSTTAVLIGSGQNAVALNPVTNRVYTANSAAGTVALVDGASNRSVSVTVGGTPVAVAVNPVTNRIYAVNSLAGTVIVIDGLTHGTSTVTVGTNPAALAVNPVTNRIYVANRGSDMVTVIDGATNGTSNIQVGSQPGALAVNPATNRIYVANYGSSNVTVIDGATNGTSTIPVFGSGPVAVAVNPVANRIYVASRTGSYVTVIQGATGTTTAVATGTGPVAVAVNPYTGKAYVANSNGNNVTVIDANNQTVTFSVGTNPCAVAVNAVTNKIYVANSGNAAVSVIDGVTNAVTSVAVGTGPAAVAVNPVSNKVYVCDSLGGTVAVIDGASNAADTTLAPGAVPLAVAVNPVTRRVYVACRGGSSVNVIAEAVDNSTLVAAEYDPVPGHATLLSRPSLAGKAVNRSAQPRTAIQSVLNRAGTGEREWLMANITSGAGTDSVRWTQNWNTSDSLIFGENLLCAVPLEAGAAITNNTGLGTPFTGNLVVYPVYRLMLNDVGVTTIVAPYDTVDSGYSQVPRARVRNFGNSDQAFDILFTIDDGYSQRISRTVVAGAESTFAFPDWLPQTRGARTVACSTQLAVDENRANDRRSKSTFVVVNDYSAAAIVAPIGMIPPGLVTPVAKLRNRGTARGAAARVVFLINSDPEYTGVVDVTGGLPVGVDTAISFQAWTAPVGYYVARCSVYTAADSAHGNDTISTTFSVREGSTQGWSAIADVPAGPRGRGVKDGGCMAYFDADGGTVYALKGAGTVEFYRYLNTADRWDTKETIPQHGSSGKKKPVKKGASMAATTGSLFVAKGNNSLEYWQYTPATGNWQTQADVPAGGRNVKEGSGSVTVTHNDTTWIYFLKGSGTTEFYRYSTTANYWEALPSAPLGVSGKNFKNGSALTYDPDRRTIYAVKGSYSEFYAYSLLDQTWATRAPFPLIGSTGKKKKVKDGAGIAWLGGRIYGLKGGNTNEFWRYQHDTNYWVQLEDVPVGPSARRVKNGGGLIAGSSGLYALRGNNTREFYVYSPTTDQALTPAAEPRTATQTPGSGVTRATLTVSPNPVTRATSIRYSLPTGGNVSLQLYDLSGAIVATLTRGFRPAGHHDLPIGSWGLGIGHSRLARGIYVLKLESGGATVTEKLVVE